MPHLVAVTLTLSALVPTLALAQAPVTTPPPSAVTPPVVTPPPAAPVPQPAAAQEPVKPSLPTEHPVEYPAPPVEGIYVSDSGVILSIEEQKSVNREAARVKAVTGLPVMVVTISSLEIMGAKPTVTLNEYGRELFKHWSVQNARDDRGVLLLLSRYDRQACAVLGAGWGNTQDAFKQRIENVTLIPTAAPPPGTGGYANGLIRAVNEVSAMYIGAGYPKEMPAGAGTEATPGALPGSGGAGDVPGGLVPVVPTSSSPVGAFAWIVIGVVVVVVIIAAALMAIASKRSQG